MSRHAARLLRFAGSRRRMIAFALLGTLVLLALAGPPALASDVYGNIGPASQIPAGGLFGRYPLTNYQLDQYFPAISVGVFSGVNTSGLLPMIAYFIAQVIWLITAFISNAVITLFAFAFSLDLVNGNGTPGSGALAPVSQAIQNIYQHTFGQPWLIAAVALVSMWAMWKALVQRRYTETAGTLALSLLYCLLALAIVTQPQRTIAPASQYANELLHRAAVGHEPGESHKRRSRQAGRREPALLAAHLRAVDGARVRRDRALHRAGRWQDSVGSGAAARRQRRRRSRARRPP